MPEGTNVAGRAGAPVKTGEARVRHMGLVCAIFAESLMTPAGIHLVSPSLPLIAQEFDSHPWAATLVPMIITLPGLLIALCAPAMGVASDRFGVRPLLIGSTLVYLTIGIAPYWLNSLTAIVASRFIFGVAESALAVCGPPLIAAAFVASARRTMIGGRMAMIGVASFGLALAGGGAAEFGWRTAFLLYGLAIVPLMLILLFVPHIETQKPTAQTAEEGARRSILPPLSLSVAYGTGIAVLFIYTPFLLREIGEAKPSVASLFSGFAAVTTAIGSICYPLIVRVVARSDLFWLALAMMGIGCLLLAIAQTPLVVGAGIFMLALGMGVFAPAAMDLILELAPPARRGRSIGLMMACIYFGTFLAPLGVNGVRGLGASLPQVYLALLLFYALSSAAALWLRPRLIGCRDTTPSSPGAGRLSIAGKTS